MKAARAPRRGKRGSLGPFSEAVFFGVFRPGKKAPDKKDGDKADGPHSTDDHCP